MLAHELITGVTQNITVILDSKQDNVLKDFRCTCCGRIVFQYYGGVKLIFPGATEQEWIDVVGRPKPIECSNERRVRTDVQRTHSWSYDRKSQRYACKRCGVQSRDDHDRQDCNVVKVKCKTVYYVIG